MSLLYTRLLQYHVRSYSPNLPQGTYVRTFALSGGGLGGDVAQTAYVLPRPCLCYPTYVIYNVHNIRHMLRITTYVTWRKLVSRSATQLPYSAWCCMLGYVQWRTSGPCGTDDLQVPLGCSAGFPLDLL
jgi:hypothetical protein